MQQKIAHLFFLCFILSACVPAQNQTDLAQAEASLSAFLQYLADGDYARADDLYGGDFDVLQSMNPLVSVDDHETLWQSGCTMNGFQCFPLLRVLRSEQNRPDEFLFTVELESAQGKPLMLEACCGESEIQGQTEFEFHVVKVNGKYLVRDMPPYVP